MAACIATCSDIIASLTDRQPAISLRPTPEWIWSSIVNAMVKGEWTVETTHARVRPEIVPIAQTLSSPLYSVKFMGKMPARCGSQN
jgi:hypothetical protein